jgi:hypothetical protein
MQMRPAVRGGKHMHRLLVSRFESR